ncbi:cyclin-A1 [Acrasis kona]|uniref:Cyclin-A1 n=1 Tax=Acrasis kona TaxID=1008807 RepID=A0AAW2ZAV9_9EUKA
MNPHSHIGIHNAPIQDENYQLFPQQGTSRSASRNGTRNAPSSLLSQQHHKQPLITKQYHPYNTQRAVLHEVTNKVNHWNPQPSRATSFVIKNNQVVSSQARSFQTNQQYPFGLIQAPSVHSYPITGSLNKPKTAPIPDLPNSSSEMDEDAVDCFELDRDQAEVANAMKAVDGLVIERLYEEYDLSLDIYRHLRNSETNHQPNCHYLSEIQVDVSEPMRGILIDWLNEVCQEYKLSAETLFLAVNVVDRTLSKQPIHRRKLQEVGITSLFIAAKYHELDPPNVDEFVFITDSTYPKEELLEMESSILGILDFNLTVITSVDFLHRFCHVNPDYDPLVFNLASFICELSLQEYDFLHYTPSAIAAASVVVALHTLGRKCWSEHMRMQTGFIGPELMACSRELLKIFRLVPTSNLTAVKNKYARTKYMEVSKLEAPNTYPNLDVM